MLIIFVQFPVKLFFPSLKPTVPEKSIFFVTHFFESILITNNSYLITFNNFNNFTPFCAVVRDYYYKFLTKWLTLSISSSIHTISIFFSKVSGIRCFGFYFYKVRSWICCFKSPISGISFSTATILVSKPHLWYILVLKKFKQSSHLTPYFL